MRSGLAERRAGLPVELTGFVGREAELAEITSLLDGSRLVTVTGTGGVGKTRVALRAAAESADRFRDGVCLVELSALRDAELLGVAVAAALGLPEQDSRSGMDAVLDHLRGQQKLLILDTCEHLVDSCAFFAEALLREATEVRLLATSRQPLDVPGELVCPLAPMSVPADDEAAAGSDALALFRERAGTAVPGFEITAGNRADVIRLCRRLDGIPLAIELAAVRLRALPLPDLVERVDRKFQVLNGGKRATQSRHQTLRGAIAWSYDLCSADEQTLWARLSVFAGDFDIRAAEEVCAFGEMDEDEITEAIISLVDKSVVLRVGEGGGRYRLLDTIREFGAEQLTSSAVVRGRHFAHYLAAASDFARHLVADDQLTRLNRLRQENPNIQAALEYSLNPGAPGAERELQRDVTALTSALYAYWQISGRLREGRHWLGRVLDRFGGLTPAQRAGILIDRACLGAFAGHADALPEAQEGTAIAAGLDDARLHARGYLAQNIALGFAGHYDDALVAGEEAERRLAALGTRTGLLTLDAQMGLLLTLAGKFDLAYQRCQQGLCRLGEDSGERWLQGYYLIEAAIALYHQSGQETECASYAARGLRLKRELRDVVGSCYGLEVFAWLAADAGRCERAAWLLGAADAQWNTVGERWHNIEILEETHQQALKKAREGLAAGRFETLYRQGTTCSPDLAVQQAISDSDTLAEAGPADGSDEPGPSGLTQREQEIAALVTEGLSNREIAERLLISRRTVDAHVEHIFTKLGISSRVQLAMWLSQR